MTPNEYQQAAQRTEKTPLFVNGDLSQSRLVHAMLGVCTEAGELQDMMKKHLIYGKPFDAVNVVEECGDVLWYLALALTSVGSTMEECMERNIAKLKRRFPSRFTEEAALNRDLESEREALEGK